MHLISRKSKELRQTARTQGTMGFMTRIDRTKEKTPLQIATDTFERSLKQLGVNAGVRASYIRDMKDIEKIRFMNMKTLAVTYIFMDKNNINNSEDLNSLDPESFSLNNMDEYLSYIIGTNSAGMTVGEIPILKTQIRNEIFTYILVVLDYRVKMAETRNIEIDKLRGLLTINTDQYIDERNDYDSDEETETETEEPDEEDLEY